METVLISVTNNTHIYKASIYRFTKTFFYDYQKSKVFSKIKNASIHVKTVICPNCTW